MIVYKPAKVVLNFSYHNREMLPLAAWSDCTSVLTVRRLFLMFLNFFWGGDYCGQNNDENLLYLSLDKLRTDWCPPFVLISHKRF